MSGRADHDAAISVITMRGMCSLSEGLRTSDEVAVDGAQLLLLAEFEADVCDAIEVTQMATAGFVQIGERVGGEDVSLASSALHAVGDVLGGVADGGFSERESGVDAGPKGVVFVQGESLAQLWEADEDEGEQSARIPLVVRHDV